MWHALTQQWEVEVTGAPANGKPKRPCCWCCPDVMLQGHNRAEPPSREQIKLRIGIPLWVVGGCWNKKGTPLICTSKYIRITKSQVFPQKWLLGRKASFKKIQIWNFSITLNGKRWSTNFVSSDKFDWGLNDDPHTQVLMSGIMTDMELDEACSILTNKFSKSQIQRTGAHASQNCYPINFRLSSSEGWKHSLNTAVNILTEWNFIYEKIHTSNVQVYSIIKIHTWRKQWLWAATKHFQFHRTGKRWSVLIWESQTRVTVKTRVTLFFTGHIFSR